MDTQDRVVAIERALTDYDAQKLNRTETIEYRGKQLSLPVVRVSPALPLLNHDNSRLAAQLKTHAKQEIVETLPTSAEAQEVLSELLSQTDKFADLRDEIKQVGQINPGIITRQGVLVNGNTRLVAARMVGAEGFDVAVLPLDATSEDCFEIEMSLQLRKLTHQDYSLTNRLLLVARYMERGGHSEDELIKRMNWLRGGKKKLAQHQRMLSLVEEIREASAVPLSYRFFDDKEQMLKDLDQKFESLSGESFQDAQNMKWMRIMGMVLGANKDQVRAIDEDFMVDSLEQRIAGNNAGSFLDKFERIKSDDPLDDLFDEPNSEPEPQVDFRAAVAEILTEAIEPSGSLNEERLEDFHELKKQIRAGADALIDQEKQTQMRMEPSERLSEARIRIEDVSARLSELFRDPSFDRRKFEFEAKKAQKAISQLNEELQRQIANAE